MLNNLKYKYPRLFSLIVLIFSWGILFSIYSWFLHEPMNNTDETQNEVTSKSSSEESQTTTTEENPESANIK